MNVPWIRNFEYTCSPVWRAAGGSCWICCNKWQADVMASLWKVWSYIGHLSPSIDAHLLEEQYSQISSWSDLKRCSLRLFLKSTNSPFISAIRLYTIGRHAFPIAGAFTWNDLPSDIIFSPSLLTFKQRLQMHLIRLSCPSLTFYQCRLQTVFSLWSLK